MRRRDFIGGSAVLAAGMALPSVAAEKVGGASLQPGGEYVQQVRAKVLEPVDVVVERDGKEILIPQVVFPSGIEDGIELGSMDFYVLAGESSVGNVLKTTWYRSVSSIKMVFDSIKGIVTGRFTLASMSGPIGVSSAVADVASQPMAVWNILYLFALIAMNLGVMNMLPIPALDGGRVFFRIVEILRFGKPINPKFEATVHGVGMTLLLMATAVIAFKDMFRLF